MKNLSSIKKYFIVEGNIGAGKSTFMRMLHNNLQMPVMYEPVHRWQSIGGSHNVLEKFYQDSQRWAYTFQSYAFLTRIIEQEHHARTHKKGMQILERSVFSDRYCFAQNCYEQGIMSELEWQMYTDWFSWLVEEHVPRPNGFIYLSCPVSKCYDRLKKRNRFEEVAVTTEYLQRLHDKHEAWLVQKKEIAASLAGVPVLVLDCSVEFETIPAIQEQLCAQVSAFMGITPLRTPHTSMQFRTEPTNY